jgi:hypothetical protein
VGQSAATNSSIAHGMGESGVNKVSFAFTLRTRVPHSQVIVLVFSLFLSSLFLAFPTYSRSCNGHTPLLIQKGCARAGQKFQPRRVGQCASPDSSIAQGNGRERGVDKVSFALTLSHFVATLARTCKCLFGVFSLFFPYLFFLFLASQPTQSHATGTPLF